MPSRQRVGTGSTVLITGAASGIGRASAVLFARQGWHCVLLDRDAEGLAQLQHELIAPASGHHLVKPIDLTHAQDMATLARELPPLHALINNAGVSHAGASALTPWDDPTVARLWDLNLQAPARLVQVCQDRLIPGARIVNVSSGAGWRAIGARGLYSPTKAGLLAQTRALAAAHPEWTVTSLSPGFVRTELVQRLMDTGQLRPEQALAKIPLGRLAEPHEMAHALFFLAAESPRLLSGHHLVVCGGSSVYGGSQALPPADYTCAPPESALHLSVLSDLPAPWREVLPMMGKDTAPALTSAYPAYLDGSALTAPVGHVTRTVQAAAQHLARSATGPASLTVLLPSRPTPWEHAGDVAAARMLISTLAVEGGSRGLRFNALEVTDSVSPAQCAPLIRYLAGPTAQYLTGQTLRLGHNTDEVSA